MVEQHGLADPCLPYERQRGARTRARAREHALDLLPLAVTTEQHRPDPQPPMRPRAGPAKTRCPPEASRGAPALASPETGPRREFVSTIEQPVEVDGDKLMQFVFRAVDEVGATLNAALVVMGDKLGWYRALAGTGGLSPAELADRTGTAERYVREWLNAQAAGGYVDYDPDSGLYSLPPEQTVALTDPSSPAYLPGFFQIAVGSVLDSPRIIEIARSGDGHGLGRARPRRPRGLRAVLPPGLQRPPGRGMAAGARRRRREARARRARSPTSAAATAPRRS